MKKLILVLAFAASLSAQAIRVDPQPATTVSSNVPVGALTPVLAIPGAAITLCGYPATGGLPCTNYATTYTTLAAGISCPSNAQVVLASGGGCTKFADAQGNFGFFVGAGTYTYEITYQGSTYGPFTLSVGGSGGGSGITAITGDVAAAGTGTVSATVNGIKNAAIPALVLGKLAFNGSSWFFDSSIYLTSNQPITFTASQDVTGSSSGTTSLSPALTVVGLRGQAIPSLASGLLRYTLGTGWVFDTNNYYYPGIVPPSQSCIGTNASSQFVAGVCSGSGLNQLTGDVTAGPGTGSQAAIVVAVNGTTVPVNTVGDQIIVTTAAAVSAWKSLPNCPDTGGNHLNYTTGSNITCGTTSSGGGGAISSIQVTAPATFFSVTPSSACTSGTCLFAISLGTQSANTFWAGPTSGSPAAPTQRTIVAADLPASVSSYTAPGAGAVPVSLANQFTAATYHGIDYGMVCNNSTDDSGGLQAAINAMSISTPVGPTRLQLPAGICLIGTQISTSLSNIEIFGAGEGATQLTAYPGSAINSIFNFSGGYVYLHDLTLDGNTPAYGIGLNVPLYSGGTTYYPSGSVSPRGDGGGNDTVATISGSTVTIYKCILTTVGHTPPNATYWTQIDTFTSAAQAAYITGGNPAGFLVEYANAAHFHMNKVGMKGGEFGLFIYATSADVYDIEMTNSYCHDFNVQPDLGNNTTMDCLHSFTSGGHSVRDVRITDNLFKNIYVGTTGPGNTSAGFIDASMVSVIGNKFEQVLNRGGGVGVVAAASTDSQWTESNNQFYRGTGLNSDLSEGLEVQISYSTYANNSIYGFPQCMGLANYSGANAGNDTFTGNTCVGTSSGHGFTILGTTGGEVIDTTVTGNSFYGFDYGIWINGVIPAQNITNRGNSFQAMTTAKLFDPQNSTGWIWTTYTPTVTITGGGYSSVSANGSYILDGKTVSMQATPAGTITGTYTNQTLTVTLPFNVQGTTFIPFEVQAPSCTNVSANGFVLTGTNTISAIFNATCAGSQTLAILASGTYQTP